MELHLGSHHFTRRVPDWRAGVLAGFAAGVVFLAVELVVRWLMGESPWWPPRMIAGIALARDVLLQAAPDAGIVLAALLVHFMLSIAFGLILAVIMAPFCLDSSIGAASLVGVVFGLAVYVINFYATTLAFPWLADARGAPSFLAHVVFGLVAADAYLIERKEDRQSGLGSAG